MQTARTIKRTLQLKRPSGTSRGVMIEKPSWFLEIHDHKTGIKGIGECSPLPGLSIDPLDKYEQVLKRVCETINDHEEWLAKGLDKFPSIRFGLETTLLDLVNGGTHTLFPSAFTEGKDSITINGLIWMGGKDYMIEQMEDKLSQGFNCIKLKIGAIDFEEELSLLRAVRERYGKEQLELRVDANGAFSPAEAPNKLDQLAAFGIHSIEQPIKQGQWNEMAALCANTPIAIALDEELIGIHDRDGKQALLETIRPQYIILKPSLVGGLGACDEWIDVANATGAGWWATSALESNVGLNAIAQWAYTKHNAMPQGLGTGQLYTNNIHCPLELKGESMWYNTRGKWDDPFI